MALTEKQEAFCRYVVETGNQTQAYIRAYDVSEDSKTSTWCEEASRMAARPEIAARIQALRERAEAVTFKRVAYDLEQAMKESDKALELALEKGNPNAMINAIRLRSDLNRLIVKQVESGKPGEFETWGEAELRSYIEACLAINKASA